MNTRCKIGNGARHECVHDNGRRYCLRNGECEDGRRACEEPPVNLHISDPSFGADRSRGSIDVWVADETAPGDDDTT